MQVSEARLAANRLNARKSTGPKTAEGKLASRGNALKHGMAGTGVVLCEGDAAEVARRVEDLEAEFRPASSIGQVLVRRMALHSVRLERAAIQEAAALAERVRHAEGDFDDRRAEAVESAFAALALDPAGSVRRLRRTPEGVDRLIDAWQGLAADLRRPSGLRWDDARAQLVDRLMGRSPSELSASVAAELSRAICEPASSAGPGAAAEGRDRMLDLIGREVAKLVEHRGTIDREAIEADRLGAADRALFDPSAEATLARRYEAAAERGLYRALREFRQVEAEALDRPSDPFGARGGLGSFGPPEPPPAPPAIPERTAPIEPGRPAPAPSRIEQAPPGPRPGEGHVLDFAIGKPGPSAPKATGEVDAKPGPRPRS